MSLYYVNKNSQSNGDHEVHKDSCSHLPDPQNREYLGVFETCGPAVTAAKKIFPKSNGCGHCSSACHTS